MGKFPFGSKAEEAKEPKAFEKKERKAGKQLPMKGKGDGKMCDYGKGDPNGEKKQGADKYVPTRPNGGKFGQGDPNGVMSKSSAAKKAAAGQDMGKPGKGFAKIAASAGKEYGSAAQGKAVAGAIFQKMRKKGTL